MEHKTLKDWWSKPLQELESQIGTDPAKGLNNDRVEENRRIFGANGLEEIKPTGIGQLIIEGIKQPMMVLLLSIAGLSLVFGKPLEATVMVFVVAAYIAVEFINKFRTDRTMARLRELTQPTTRVIRDGKRQEIKTADVVVGDVVILPEGARVPADLRLIEAFGLTVNEAALTGESLPVRKDAAAVSPTDAPIGERKNCVFSGTTILSGEGRGIAMAVGKASELGVIAIHVQAQKKEKTFIQQSMTRLAGTLAVLAVVVSILIPLVGFFRGQSPQEMIVTWLALTFLMIPGQPPVIITMALALASFELARNKVVVKRLRGAEVLGQINEIVTDKTGTITENKMLVEHFILPDGEEKSPHEIPQQLAEKISLCLPRFSNDPTDKAVAEAVPDSGKKREYDSMVDFSNGHPWRSLTYGKDHTVLHAVAGPPELLANTAGLPDKEKNVLLEVLRREAGEGKRVVGFSLKETAETDKSLENSRLLAFAVLSDPVRPGVKEAVAALRKGGISTIMVTGDYPATAASIAKEVGIGEYKARILPVEKQELVSGLKKKGATVAVIGDGVNDAPALRAADDGIAMGEIGTDLAKETSDLILTDDNFVHLPSAVATGRKALDNFRKGLTYYLTAKAILLFIFLVPLGLGIPFPLAPIHIILIELLMDLASSTIFVTEAAEPGLMERPPQKISGFLNWSIGAKIVRNGSAFALVITTIYLWLFLHTGNLALAQTAVFVTWLLGHILLALNLKQERLPLLKQGIFANRFGTFWLLGMIALALFVTQVPVMHRLFQTTFLPPAVWLVIIIGALVSTFWIEAFKFLS